jgi:alpha-beta hydrolase superfamily lysophospholipase
LVTLRHARPAGRLAALCFTLTLTACGHVKMQPAGPPIQEPVLRSDHALMADGYRLPLHHWRSGEPADLVVLGVHGFGDYGNGFAALASALVGTGNTAVYAYDQRGFGATERVGIWPGGDTLVDDLRVLAALLREHHPDRPLYVVGESMGGAVVLRALTEEPGLDADGAVLLAPAVWGPGAMPWYQRLGLWIMLRVAPGATFSGDSVAHLGIRMTDDPEVLHALREDPLVQRRARIDTLHGLGVLMGEALNHPPEFTQPTLVLYGLNDQVVPPGPVCEWFNRLAQSGREPPGIVLYPEGYHLLTRYLQAAHTLEDIAAWLEDPSADLPSGQQVSVHQAKRRVCELHPRGRRTLP